MRGKLQSGSNRIFSTLVCRGWRHLLHGLKSVGFLKWNPFLNISQPSYLRRRHTFYKPSKLASVSFDKYEEKNYEINLFLITIRYSDIIFYKYFINIFVRYFSAHVVSVVAAKNRSRHGSRRNIGPLMIMLFGMSKWSVLNEGGMCLPGFITPKRKQRNALCNALISCSANRRCVLQTVQK